MSGRGAAEPAAPGRGSCRGALAAANRDVGTRPWPCNEIMKRARRSCNKRRRSSTARTGASAPRASARSARERIVSGGCADDVVEETAQNYRTKLADQYRENRAKARSYERRARDDLQGPCVDLRGAARGAANLEKSACGKRPRRRQRIGT